MEKHYNPAHTEDKWYAYWLENNFFNSSPDHRKPYTILIPPPNITGILHMGHMLNNTIQDALIRRARLQGYNACWVPGTDHASIATESKVVAFLKSQGIEKSQLTRKEFLEHAYKWNDKYGSIILKQLHKLGASCDWNRTRFTMEPSLSKAVIHCFVQLYKKGKIYRGNRISNWDCIAKTAISDQEVYHQETQSTLYYVNYKIENTENEYITIATVRPETIMGDTAVCVHPNDPRYQHLRGKNAIVPIVNRPVPIIFDEYIDIDFGTGVLKVTPAHDINDYELGLKHQLNVIDTINKDGTMNENAVIAVGKDRFEARKIVAQLLEEQQLLVKTETITNNIGYSERTNAVVEPKLTEQWYMKMEETAKPALEAVMNDTVQFVPDRFKNTYKYFMENIRDWCISRQLWWGQQIPAYYLPNGEFVVAETPEEALLLAQQKTNNPALTANQLTQDPDVLDTWFSSWLWPISVFDGFEADKTALNYYYPSTVLVTGFDILFFWVARMVMAGYEFMGEKPFKHVYYTGLVRDKQRRKMSKQLGNSPDPLDIIAENGADALRLSLLMSASAGNDILYDEKLLELGRNFNNKIWNALRLIKAWETTDTQNKDNQIAIQWFENKLNLLITEFEHNFENYRLSEAAKQLYSFIWDDFCATYLELIKPDYQQPIDKQTLDTTIQFFETLMILLHPFCPFITEEIYQELKPRAQKESICIATYPKATANPNAQALQAGDTLKNLLTELRNVRNQQQLKQRDLLQIYVQTQNPALYKNIENVLLKKAFLSIMYLGNPESTENNTAFLLQNDKIFVILPQSIDNEKEIQKIKDELAYYITFKEQIEVKLNNERFVQNAKPDIVARERQKLADAETKIKILTESIL